MNRTAVIILTVLTPFGLGYYLSYLLRTMNVIIAPALVAELGLGASDLGFLTSVYFIAFAAFQVPLGVLLDRYGPRRVQAVLLLFAALGSAMFAVGESFTLLAVARSCIGLGVSGCLMGAFKANVMWWPRERLALVNGCTVAFGSFGALSATVPVEMLLQVIGWRAIFALSAAATLALAVLTFLLVPDRQTDSPAGGAPGGVTGSLRELRMIFASSFFWRISIVAFMHNASFLSYQTLWMGPWLRDVAGMAAAEAARSLLLFNLGMFVGVLIIGAVADRLQRIGVRPIILVGIGFTASIGVQLMFALEATALATPLCIAFGFFGSCTVLVYAVFGQRFPAHLIGRVNTAQNLLIFLAAFIAQWGIGAIINLWPAVDGTHYDQAAHQAAFVVMIGLQLAALAWFLWPRRRLDNDGPAVS